MQLLSVREIQIFTQLVECDYYLFGLFLIFYVYFLRSHAYF